MRSKVRVMKWAFFSLLFLIGDALYSQTDYWAYQVYFSGNTINHIPAGIRIPDNDKESRAIINSIINGSSYEKLREQFPDSLEQKLEKLISGKVIERDGNGFKCLFPVLVNKKRVELQKIIENRLAEYNFSLDTILYSLRQLFPRNPDLIFHFLWSRIMDDCWWDLYNQSFGTDKGPPNIAFIVYPLHPFQCGTNSDYSADNDMFAMSWSYNIFDPSLKVPPAKSFFELAAKKNVPESDREFFMQHGLIDSANQSILFTYHGDDKIDAMCDSLKKIYVGKLKGLFNYSELSKSFQIPVDEFFLVVTHEVAYEIIQQLYNKKKIFVPITKKDNPNINFKYLVSIRYGN